MKPSSVSFQSYVLNPLTCHGKRITFEWNPQTGELRGESASLVESIVADARQAGYVVGHPYPTTHTIGDPLRSVADMAVVLGNDWVLQGDLAAAYPQFEMEAPIMELDADGVEHPSEFQPLF